MLNIVLFGPPGAGKGTQSEKLIDEYQLVHLSTGDILRAEVAAGTELGLEAKKLMDEGILVPDEIVIEMISAKLDQNKHAKGFIFDGFPRTANQAKALDKLLQEKNTSITKMISLKVTDEELIERLLLRGKESGRPDDQDEDIILNRIQEYNEKTAPLEDYYASQGKFEAIDGIGDISEIFYAISSVIKDAEIKEAFGSYDDDDDDTDEEELVESEKESYGSRASYGEETETAVLPKESKPKVAKKPAAKKAPKKEKEEKKEAAPKKVAKKAGKKAAKKSVKKAGKKAAKKAAPKKSVKKAAKKVTKKVAKKAAKKAAPKKTVKKAAKKVTKKVVAKKVAKKASKKAAPKKSLKKSASKKAVKKSLKKAASKKSAPKKSLKKAAGKKSAKKSNKKGRR